MIDFLNNLNKSRMCWVLLLSLALLCAQGLKLHSHHIDHTHTTSESAIQHTHASEFHLSVDVSHAGHHHEAVSELDLGLNALPQKNSVKVLTLAFLVTILVLYLSSTYLLSCSRRRSRQVNVVWRCHFFPPLRAPPL
jgi:hypothetical protein